MHQGVPDVWERALGELRRAVDPESFATWLGTTKLAAFDDATLVVSVPNDVSRNWLASHFMDQISSVVERLVQRPVDIAFEVRQTPPEGLDVAAAPGVVAQPQEAFHSARLNEHYTFENFIVGESNRFAHAAARAVADSTTRTYNPLFIYGGVGLGKTHLMEAIGHQALHAGRRKVLYATSEDFLNSFIDSVTRGSTQEFRNYYRRVDLLLIDDVQFFMGKESTQTEFFHTFNALYDSGRKIVVTSDRPPKELNNLEERLRSRFEWGLIVDIQPPDLETRMAILRTKAEWQGIDLPYDLAIYIAERIKTNVRKLEGVLTQIRARHAFNNGPLTKDDLRGFLAPFLIGEEPRKISPERISSVVCEYFDVEPQDLRSKSRLRKHTLPRHIAMYLSRNIAKSSFPEIGKSFGGRDHSSVMHACRKIERRVNAEVNVQNLVTYLTKRIQEPA
jgi:chromosomal replication initiator protein